MAAALSKLRAPQRAVRALPACGDDGRAPARSSPEKARQVSCPSDRGRVVVIGERLLLTVPAFAAISLVLVGGWLAVVAMINRTSTRTAPSAPPIEVL